MNQTISFSFTLKEYIFFVETDRRLKIATFLSCQLNQQPAEDLKKFMDERSVTSRRFIHSYCCDVSLVVTLTTKVKHIKPKWRTVLVFWFL